MSLTAPPVTRVATAAAGLAVLVAIAACTPADDSDTRPVTVAAAGDIVCTPLDDDFNDGAGTDTECRHRATSDLIARLDPTAVLALGDTQYDRAVLANYQKAYDPTWGQFKEKTYPVPGNHEYKNEDADGYFDYFGDRAGDPDRGYYSFDLGAWHLIALNSECEEVGGCDRGSPQERWLRNDLAANQEKCTLAYWHSSRFSSGEEHGSNDDYDAFWQALYDGDADVVLSAHDHIYERLAPLDPAGRIDTQRGMRAFVVGTGGAEHQPVGERVHGSEVADDTTYGVLELTLNEGGYRWRFVPVPGGAGFTDSGSDECH